MTPMCTVPEVSVPACHLPQILALIIKNLVVGLLGAHFEAERNSPNCLNYCQNWPNPRFCAWPEAAKAKAAGLSYADRRGLYPRTRTLSLNETLLLVTFTSSLSNSSYLLLFFPHQHRAIFFNLAFTVVHPLACNMFLSAKHS